MQAVARTEYFSWICQILSRKLSVSFVIILAWAIDLMSGMGSMYDCVESRMRISCVVYGTANPIRISKAVSSSYHTALPYFMMVFGVSGMVIVDTIRVTVMGVWIEGFGLMDVNWMRSWGLSKNGCLGNCGGTVGNWVVLGSGISRLLAMSDCS